MAVLVFCVQETYEELDKLHGLLDVQQKETYNHPLICHGRPSSSVGHSIPADSCGRSRVFQVPRAQPALHVLLQQLQRRGLLRLRTLLHRPQGPRLPAPPGRVRTPLPVGRRTVSQQLFTSGAALPRAFFSAFSLPFSAWRERPPTAAIPSASARTAASQRLYTVHRVSPTSRIEGRASVVRDRMEKLHGKTPPCARLKR